MKLYRIQSRLGKTYKKYFLDIDEARNWVINTLDLSLSWSIDLYPSDVNKIKG